MCGLGGQVTSKKIGKLGKEERRSALRQKANADLLFLFGLLLGGPIVTFGSQLQIGLLVCLAGAVSSALRRYTSWSVPGILTIAGLTSAVVWAAVFEPRTAEAAEEARESALTPLQRREIFASRLAERLEGEEIRVQARGPDLVTIWFYLPAAEVGPCGDYPAPEVRARLAELDFQRVVVASESSLRGLCSFEP